MTIDELKRYDGKEGRRAYVAYRGKIYDVTESPLWKSGEHQGMHSAGRDLTEAMGDAPHGEEIFSGFPSVGDLETAISGRARESAGPDNGTNAALREWYRRYHPHPMTVHFPIALHLFAAGMDLLFLADPQPVYAACVFYTFLAATIGGAAAMVPGVMSWWVNYAFVLTRPFVVKVLLSLISLLLGIAALTIRFADPDVAFSDDWYGIFYHGTVLLTGMLVIVIGYYGGKLTWHSGGSAESPIRTGTEKPFGKAEPLRDSESQPLGADGLSLLIGGAAGTGIQSLENLLADAFRRSGYYLFATKEYMSRVRGGSNTTQIRVSDSPLAAASWNADLFVAIDADALEHARERLGPETLILADASFADGREGITPLPMASTARELGNRAVANSYAAGAIFGVLGLDDTPLNEAIRFAFSDRSPEINLRAAELGYTAGRELKHVPFALLPAPGSMAERLHLMNGSTAAGFGFMAGGCNFVASYPMSPSTGVLNFMASMTSDFELVVEQSEDEIAAINMVIGAWYAGGRALTTTSGGGFALMGEGISLAGMTETPAVIYLAQRPGPATGLPTRTEQGDLNLAIYAGHGDFPRIVLAPGTTDECIMCGHMAFELADRFQLPVIVMSDQYLADSMMMTAAVDFNTFEHSRNLVETEETYRRYGGGEKGTSPRGVPGWGTGTVCSVSDEHDSMSQITEDAKVRETMVARRKAKMEAVRSAAWAPLTSGSGEIAVVGWGSTRGAIAEALARLDDSRLFQVHFNWVYPLERDQLRVLETAGGVMVVENNVNGQFSDLLEQHGVTPSRRILQNDGFPFFSDLLAERIATALKELS